MSSKSNFVDKIVVSANSLAALAETFDSLNSTYFDRGYNSGGSNVLLDADIPTQYGALTAANVASFITLIQQFDNFLNNVAVATGDYDATLNVVRNDI